MDNIKKSLFILNLFFLVHFVNGQNYNGVVVYKKTLTKAFSYNTIRSLKLREFSRELDEISNDLEYKLEFNNIESKFYVIERMSSEDDRMIEFANRLGSGHGIRYSNIKTKESLYQKDTYGKQFLIQNNLDSIKWQLSNMSKIISGYICYKAFTTKTIVGSKRVSTVDVIAWYAPKVPAPFGPLGYVGLPGLIIELQADKYKYYMTKIELNFLKKVKIKKPIEGVKMTLQEFQEYEKKLAGYPRNLFRN
jgi:GLPGLI family protein